MTCSATTDIRDIIEGREECIRDVEARIVKERDLK